MLTHKLPEDERFGLVNQMRRTAISVPSNIAEGQAHQYPNDFRRFLFIARGSLAEVETQALIARDLNYLADGDSLLEGTANISVLLNGLIRNLKARDPKVSEHLQDHKPDPDESGND